MPTTGKRKKDPNRFQPNRPPGLIKAVLQGSKNPKSKICDQLEDRLNEILRKRCSSKEFEQTSGACGGGGGSTALVDLIIVIDTSGSMSDEATDLSIAADAAIQAAAQSCPSDLRVAWFGIEGTWPGTNFTQSYRAYLNGLGVPNASIVGTPSDFEDGAAAVIDISNHFDWRSGAARAIFYLGDEALEGGDPQDANDVTAANNAISAANLAGVKVFTYLGTNTSADPGTITEYARLANDTGGQAFTAPVANLGGFQAVLEKIICDSSQEACREIEEPKVVPCLRLDWGDGPGDRIETDDTEVLCITVCNPYSNVTFKDFTLHLAILDPGGSLPTLLPDGTPSVEIKPDYMICYGDISPCDPQKPEELSCVSREVVLMSRGATEGVYQIYVAYCFDACFTQLAEGEAFRIELVKS